MRLLPAAFCLLVPGAAQAGTNLPALADYPAPNCVRPEKPVLAPETTKVVPAGGVSFTTGKRDMSAYNKQVAQYNAALSDYTACMGAYVANAQADMDLIRDKANKAVTAANAP